MVKNPPAMQETQVQSLGPEDPLKKEMATHSSIPAWEIQCTKEFGRLHTVHGVAKQLDTTERLNNKNYFNNCLKFCLLHDLRLVHFLKACLQVSTDITIILQLHIFLPKKVTINKGHCMLIKCSK